ncbi:MAG: oxidoreductase alpha (molybdopterin) subunit [Cyanobacteria bacterium RYN_339]|nr:oxidoreductase alpha (molybdopterin) subunit [Cyanobacteria bacterium RYN_339]
MTEPKEFAGGIPAVVSSLQHVFGETSLLKGLQALSALNQHGGFDCPSCAWPDPDGHRSIAEFCENGAKAVGEEATEKRVTPEFFAQHPIAELARQEEFWLGKQGRLTHPMWKPAGATHYEPIGWDAAFDLVATHLKALASPDEALFYTSGRTSNEAAFLYQLFARRFGTNNLPDCSNMCHESSGLALTQTLGIGKGTVTLGDFELADAIFVVGQNPGTNHPRMLTALQKAAKRGCKIVSINPLPETGLKRFKHPQEVAGVLGAGTALECLHVPVRINGDVAFFKGVLKAMREAGALDAAFIADHTDGFEALAQDLDAARWEDLTDGCGVDEALIREAAQIAIDAERVIATWAMGLTQHQNAVATIREVVNFLLIKGQVGKPGAGACPVRGHSNEQGDRTMGITERPSPAFLDRLEAEYGFPPPRTHGLDTVGAIQAMHAGSARVFFALGGNFLSAAPDTAHTAEALSRCDLTVQVSTKLNGSHAVTGRQALILPCLSRTELDLQATGAQLVSTENSMGIVQASQGKLTPASEHLKSEIAIVAALARSVLNEDWSPLVSDYDRIREAISRVVPGHDDYNRRLRQQGGFYLPNPPRDSRTFPTTTGKARFTVNALPHHDLAPDQLLLMTIRSHDQFNTTIYGLDDRYRGIKGERRVVFLNADDARERGLTEASRVDLVGHFKGQERLAPGFRVVIFPLPRRCAAAYFPEANALVPVDSYAEGSRTPTSKSIVVTLRQA